METQTFLYSRACSCQLHLYKEVFYADSDIFLCISCAQNKLELAGVGYPNLFSLLPYGQVVWAWWGSHAFWELWNNLGWKETWEVSSPISCLKQGKLQNQVRMPRALPSQVQNLYPCQELENWVLNHQICFSFLSCLSFFSCNLWHLPLSLGTVYHKEEYGSTASCTH